MNGKTYSFLDLAGIAVVGETLLDQRPAFAFSADGSRILFANASGVALFGERWIGDLLERRFSDLNPIKVQAARLARVLPGETAQVEMLRIGQGVGLAALPAACRGLDLADNARAVLAIVAAGGMPGSLTARAERLVDAFDSNDYLAAVLTGEGKVVAASGGFDDLAPVEPAIDHLVAVAVGSPDRVTKQRLAASGRPSGTARFRADDRDLILVLVGPAESANAEGKWREASGKPVPSARAERERDPPEIATTEADVLIESPIEAMLPDVEAEIAAEDAAEKAAPVARFVWETDPERRFTFVSPELAAAVGEKNAATVGMRWDDVARVLSLDPNGVVGAAFERGAGFVATVYWPVADGTHGDGEKIAIDLAAIPAPSRPHAPAGFRGFGVCRANDRMPDDRAEPAGLDAVQLAPIIEELPASSSPTEPVPELTAEPLEEPLEHHEREDVDDAARKSVEQGSRHPPGARPDAARVAGSEAPAPFSNIVRMPGASPTRAPPENLTGTEREAFRRIAEALGSKQRGEARAPVNSPTREVPQPNTGSDSRTGPQEANALVSEIDTRLLDRLPVGIVIFRDRKTLFANRTLLDLLGYDSFDAFVDGGGAEAVFPGGDGVAGSIADTGGKLTAKRRDGSSVLVKSWLHAVTFWGSTALMLSISVGAERAGDTDDELVVELARSEARAEELEAILDTATDGVIVIDGRGKIGSMNHAAEALFGVNASEYRGRYFTDLLADESQKAALDYLDGLAANGVASVLNDGREVIGRVPQGGLIPLFMNMGRIGDTDKFCAVLRDITHWKNVEGELIAARRAAETANAQKSDFLAKISHEIRTPLNAIIGFSEVMMEQRFGPIGNDRYRDYLHDIHVSGAHLMSLINDLLDLSKIEAGKLDLSFEAVPVNAMIQECVALMQPQANRERIIIRTSLSADVPNVVADLRSFRQILLNLMSNAIKFTRAGGQVIVSSAIEESGQVVVRIRDTGIGMSAKDIETALKPFRQVALSRDDREHGTGLGLPLTKALVEANRATFSIDSAVDQGTLVKITFPTTRVLAG